MTEIETFVVLLTNITRGVIVRESDAGPWADAFLALSRIAEEIADTWDNPGAFVFTSDVGCDWEIRVYRRNATGLRWTRDAHYVLNGWIATTEAERLSLTMSEC